MRIVYLHQYFNTPDMAGGTRSYEMARRLVAWGHEVHMVTSWRESTERRSWFTSEEAGIQVHWLPVPYGNYMGYRERVQAFLRFAWKAARKAASISADIIFATSTPLTIAIPAIYAARRQKIPMVFEVRDLWPEVPIALGALNNRLTISSARLLERFAYRSAARVVALAPGMRDGVCSTGYPKQQVAIIPNGADIKQFQQSSAPPLDGAYPWIGDGRLIVYIGTIGPANGVEYIIRFAAALRGISTCNNIRFAILGDGRCLESVKALAQQLEVINSRVFFPGCVAKKEVPTWLARSTATIMTYDGPEVLYRDSVSNKFFDSMAAARPIFANFRGFSTIVGEAEGAGIILPKDDLNAAAVQFSNLINNDDWLAAGRKNAFRLATEYFDRDQLAGDLQTVLQQAVTGADPEGAGLVGQSYADLWCQHASPLQRSTGGDCLDNTETGQAQSVHTDAALEKNREAPL